MAGVAALLVGGATADAVVNRRPARAPVVPHHTDVAVPVERVMAPSAPATTVPAPAPMAAPAAPATPAAAPAPATPAAAPVAPVLAAPAPPPAPRNYVPVAATPSPLNAVGTRSGGETARVQQRLLDLGFWLSGADGEYGLTTRQAVMAFQKYVGIEASGSVDATTANYLGTFHARARGWADAGSLVEIDKTRQLVFIVKDGMTQWVFNTSTANGGTYTEPDRNTPGEEITGTAITPDGVFEVNRERPEGWWEGDLGEIYRPKYFNGGIALHGSNSVPNYPASHGCVRLSVAAMDFVWDSGIVPMGETVWVHSKAPASMFPDGVNA